MKTIINLLIKILHIFAPKRFTHLLNYETVSYLFFGGLTTVVGLGSYAFFIYYFGMGAAVAGAVSNVLAIIFAFVTNKAYVFESPSWQPRILLPELVKFGAARALTFILDVLALALLVDMLGFNAMHIRLLTMVVIHFIGNYALSKWVVFTKKEEKMSRKKLFVLSSIFMLLMILLVFILNRTQSGPEAEIAGVYNDYESQMKAVVGTLKQLRDTILTSTAVEKRELLKSLIERIVWDGEAANIFLLGEPEKQEKRGRVIT